jgi:dTMP kinase
VRGIFLVFEGPEGSGKSTQARKLADRFRACGYDVVLTREPGGTPIGEQIRKIVLGEANCAMLAETEALLYSAARAQHVREVIQPALEQGKVVISDRYADSTLAYQGGGRGLPMDQLLAVQTLATGGLWPDLRLLLDLPVEIGLARRLMAEGEVNRLDRTEVAFHQRVRRAYLELALANPEGWAIIDAEQEPERVAVLVVEAVTARLGVPLCAESLA